MKQHASEYGVDPEKVIASGGSSGGTLSLLVALATGPDTEDDLLPKGNRLGQSLRAVDGGGPRTWLLQSLAPERGAHIYYGYEDGRLTDEPLWPWPMNPRIRQLAGIDVTATVFGLGEP